MGTLAAYPFARSGGSASNHAHAALRAVQGPLAGRGEPAMGARHHGDPDATHGPADVDEAHRVAALEDVPEDGRQQAGRLAVRVAPRAATAPAEQGPHDEIAGRLV